MKHAKEKEATAAQAFPFQACFNEQIILRSRKRALKERICESVQGQRKGSDCNAGISFSGMFQRANNSAKQKNEL